MDRTHSSLTWQLAGDIPEVHPWPYDYGKDARTSIPQTEPPAQPKKVAINPA